MAVLIMKGKFQSLYICPSLNYLQKSGELLGRPLELLHFVIGINKAIYIYSIHLQEWYKALQHVYKKKRMLNTTKKEIM